MEFLVLFRSPKSKTEHSTVRLRLKTSTKTILSTTSTIHYNSHINNHNLVKYYQISALTVNSEVAATASSTLPPGERPHGINYAHCHFLRRRILWQNPPPLGGGLEW